MKWTLCFFLLPFVGLSQNCNKKYFEIIDTNSRCVTVQMSDWNYASLYRDSKSLEAINDSLPKLLKGFELERVKAHQIDSSRVVVIGLQNRTIEECEEINTSLLITSKKLEIDRDHHKNYEGKWKESTLIELAIIIIMVIL